MDGLLPIDKPKGMTSFDVIARVRKATDEQKVGHMGTLDKHATGLLLVMIGRCTKLKRFFGEKVSDYRFSMRFGEQTDTLDVDGEVVRECEWEHVTAEGIRAALPDFVGHIEQAPPRYSAVKIEGRRASDWARDDERDAKPPEPRPVEVRGLELIDYDPPDATLETRLVSGGYVRSIVRDLSAALDSCATTTAIRRTRTNHIAVEDALPLDELSAETVADHLLGPKEMVRKLPAITLTDQETIDIGHGKRPPLGDERRDALDADEGDWIACYDDADELVAVARVRELEGTLCIQPRRVMKPRV